MPILAKQTLSGSNSGAPIMVTATAAAGAKVVHQVQATATNVLELVTLWLWNSATTNVTVQAPNFEVTNGATSGLIVQFAGHQDTGQRSPTVIFRQLPLSSTDTVIHTHSTATETYYVWGYVDRVATG